MRTKQKFTHGVRKQCQLKWRRTDNIASKKAILSIDIGRQNKKKRVYNRNQFGAHTLSSRNKTMRNTARFLYCCQETRKGILDDDADKLLKIDFGRKYFYGNAGTICFLQEMIYVVENMLHNLCFCAPL